MPSPASKDKFFSAALLLQYLPHHLKQFFLPSSCPAAFHSKGTNSDFVPFMLS